MGNWDEAERFRLAHPDPEPTCPFCSEQRMVELVGQEYVCYVCARTWKAVTYMDSRMLKNFGIKPS